MMNTGSKPIASKNNLLSTIAWKIGDEVTYALEGSIFMGGATVQWLRDQLGLISKYELNGMELVVRGVLAIQSGESPRALEQRLLTYLHPKKRPKKDKE